MTVLLFLVAGLVLGAVTERLIGPGRAAEDASVGVAPGQPGVGVDDAHE